MAPLPHGRIRGRALLNVFAAVSQCVAGGPSGLSPRPLRHLAAFAARSPPPYTSAAAPLRRLRPSSSRIASSSSSADESQGSVDDRADLLDYVGLSLSGPLPPVRTVDPERTIFCNRETNMAGIRAVGFDMDYTLAQYVCPAFDSLAFNGAREKLVNTLGYPAEVANFVYNPAQWTRGLIIDTNRGNFLKIDRHKYVRVAFHGSRSMSSELRKALYARAFNKVPSFSEKSYVNMDTLFQLVDAHMFASLVDLKDTGDHEFMDSKTYRELFRDVRYAVDLCHRDGVIKDEVAKEPDKYIVPDPEMVPMLRAYKDAGIKVFLLTNSLWEYTDVVMNFLFHERHTSAETASEREWLSLFDLIIVGSSKPAFMLDLSRPLYRVHPSDGSLKNTDGKFEIDALGPGGAEKFLAQGHVFQGGQFEQLQAMLGIGSGDEILYVGDHLFSDVLRSKRTLGWRTALVVPELAHEVATHGEYLEDQRAIGRLRALREEVNAEMDGLRRRIKRGDGENIVGRLADLESDYGAIKSKLSALARENHARFHPAWGQLFRAGYQDSRFAFYVQNYACLYTSKASNMAAATEFRTFHPVGERLPHDQLIDAGARVIVGDD